ncbi:uncharacterized protein ACO6RY_13667 [Pungitius sinensis]
MDRVQSTSRTWTSAKLLVPTWLNELSDDIRTAQSLYIFCRKLKTHLFKLYLD